MDNEYNEYIISVPISAPSAFNLLLAGITYENPSYRISRSNSPECITEYVMSGAGYIEINGKTYTVNSGDMYIIPSGVTHTYYADPENPFRKIWFNCRGILADELRRIYKIENVVVFKNADGYGYLDKILKLCENKSLSGEEISSRASVIFFELTVFLAARHNSDYNEISTEAFKIKSYIDSNIDKNISLKELSNLIYRSESQTLRIFKSAFSQTPHEYILSQKISRASLLLKNTNMPIKDISLRLGFCDEHYFSNLYKKKTGHSPSSERKITNPL